MCINCRLYFIRIFYNVKYFLFVQTICYTKDTRISWNRDASSSIVRLCNFRAPIIVNYSAVLFIHRDGHLSIRIYSSIEESCNLYYRRNRKDDYLHPNCQTRDSFSINFTNLHSLSIASFDRSCLNYAQFTQLTF